MTSSPAHLDQLPVFSPDGRRIVFTRSFGPRARELFVVPASGGAERQLTFDRQPTYGAAWTSDSREIVFSSNRSGGGESLWRVPVGGGEPRRLSATLQGAFYPAISRSGNRLVYTESFQDTNIYSSDGLGSAGRPMPGHFAEPRLLITSSRRDDSPNISARQSQIVLVSRRTGNEEIWRCGLDGRNPQQLTSFKGPAAGTPRWSPDGDRIAFDSIATGNPDIYTISADGSKLRRLTGGSFGTTCLRGRRTANLSTSNQIDRGATRSGLFQLTVVQLRRSPATVVPKPSRLSMANSCTTRITVGVPFGRYQRKVAPRDQCLNCYATTVSFGPGAWSIQESTLCPVIYLRLQRTATAEGLPSVPTTDTNTFRARA